MRKAASLSLEARALRKRAEQKLRDQQRVAERPLSQIDARALVHELQVHQIELELQNEELHRAQVEARQTADKYAELFDFAPVGYFVLDLHGLIREVNLAGAALLGLDRQGVTGQPFDPHVNPGSRASFSAFCHSIQTDEDRRSCETRLLKQSQVPCDVLVEATLAKDGCGRNCGWRLAVTDITERKSVEEKLQKFSHELERRVAERTAELQTANDALRLSREAALNLAEEAVEARERAEQAAAQSRESEGRFHTMADSAPVLIWMSGTDKRCHYFNKPWLEFTGRTMKQEQGDGWAEGVHPDDLPRCLETYVTSFEARQEFRMEYRLRRHDGQYRWILDHGVPRFASECQFVGYIGSCIDITDRKEAEEVLRVRQAQLELVASVTPVLLTQCSRDLRYVYVNRAYAAMLGTTPEQVVGRSIVEIMGPAGFETIRAHVDAVLQGRPVEYEATVPFKGVGPRALRVAYMPDTDAQGQVRGWVASIIDVTDRKRMQVALTESEARLGGILRSAMDAIITVDAAQQIVLFNPAAEQMFRCTAGEALGTQLDRFIPQSVRTAHREHVQKFAATGATMRRMGQLGAINGRRADGQEFPIEASISQTEMGGARLFTVILRDITERQQAEAALQREREQLEMRVQQRTAELSVANRALQVEIVQHQQAKAARLHLLRRLADAEETERGRLSRELHDQFGQELTAMKLALQVIGKQSASSRVVQRCVRQLQDLTDGLIRNMHRVAWELHPPVLDDFGLDAALRRYVNEWSEQTGLRVDFHGHGVETCRLPAEIETALYRVAQEALLNVFRHAQARCVSLLLDRRPNHASLIVEDDGQGFDAATALQAPGALETLGVMGMRERVTLAGGTLDIESTPGVGTTLFVRIPLERTLTET